MFTKTNWHKLKKSITRMDHNTTTSGETTHTEGKSRNNTHMGPNHVTTKLPRVAIRP